jgi:hypothetical protein
MTTSFERGGTMGVAPSRSFSTFLIRSSSLPARAAMADRPEASGHRARSRNWIRGGDPGSDEDDDTVDQAQ